jgi:hypothetical protein
MLVEWFFLNRRTIAVTKHEWDKERHAIVTSVKQPKRVTLPEIANAANVSVHTLRSWREGQVPSLQNFVACTQWLGRDLVPMSEPIELMSTHFYPALQFQQELREARHRLNAKSRGQDVHRHIDEQNDKAMRDAARKRKATGTL